MSADSVITSLRKKFPDSQIFGTDIHPKEWLYLSEKLDLFFRIPKATEFNFITSISRIVVDYNIDFIIPLTDSEVDVLSKNRDQIEKHSAKLTLPHDKVVKLCRNKEEFSHLLKQHRHIKVIETITKEKLRNKDYKFPLIAKPKRGRSSEGLRFIESDIELSTLDDEYIVQPFIEGDIITVDVVRDMQEKLVCLPRKELIRSSNGAGLSVEIFQDSKIEKLIMEITKTLNITGCMNIEFIKSSGHYYLMDINPRFSAGVGFSSIAGYDFIENHIRVYLNKEVQQLSVIDNFIATKHYTDFKL